MDLIIAEKPSVARAICAALGVGGKHDGYFENGQHVVSWCFGHLVQLVPPPAYGEKYEKWAIEDLPILPNPFKTQLMEDGGAKKQFKVLRDLMKRGDINSVVCATDADREGELIFRLVYEKAGCKKPVKRFWTSSLEEAAVLAAYKNMKSGSVYDGLADAGRGRQRADWLIGMNLTRLYTKMYNKKMPCGRVQTPTVAEIVKRQRAIDNFEPVAYYHVVADLGDFHATHRMDGKEDAEALAKLCVGKTGTISKVEKKSKTTNAPALYNLTELQKDANRYLGFPAKRTLAAAQSLYEKQLTTYPRTDSRYITSDMEDSVRKIIKNILAAGYAGVPTEANFSSPNMKVIINDKKVESHPGITPTINVNARAYDGLADDEQKVLLLVSYRLLIAVYKPYKYISTSVEVDLAEHVFSARGKQVVDAGWKLLEDALKKLLKNKAVKNDDEDDQKLPELKEGDTRKCEKCEALEKFTKPPANYTDESLLEFMKTAGKKIDDEALRDAMKDLGLGTSATRADIIDNIVRTGYVERKGKKLFPTPLAFVMVDAVTSQITEPEMTAQWEKQLADVSNNKGDLEAFLKEIEDFCRYIVEHASINETLAAKLGTACAAKTVAACPRCGSNVLAKKNKYECSSNKFKKNDDGTWSQVSGCGFGFWNTVAGKKLSESAAKQLCEKGKTGVIKGFTSKAGKKFDAALALTDDGKTAKIEFVFNQSDNKGASGGRGAAQNRGNAPRRASRGARK